MQFKIFTVPIGDNGSALQEMNAFLRGNKIIEVENNAVPRFDNLKKSCQICSKPGMVN
jgi:hypothetical protein